MKTHLSLLPLAIAVLATGCANTGADYEPISDGPRNTAFTHDLSACQQVATRRDYLNGDTGTDALIGASLGALAGLADNDVSNAEGAAAGLVIGAVVGGGAGMRETMDQRREIVVACMQGRGHRVVG